MLKKHHSGQALSGDNLLCFECTTYGLIGATDQNVNISIQFATICCNQSPYLKRLRLCVNVICWSCPTVVTLGSRVVQNGKSYII